MKILSVKQPWAGLLVMGIKTNETRSFNTKHHGLLGIHSSAKMDANGKEILAYMEKHYTLLMLNGGTDLCTKLGCILGTVELIDTESTNDQSKVRKQKVIELILGNYEPGRWYWKCERPKILTTPIPAKGMLGLWSVSDGIEDLPYRPFILLDL